MKLHALGGEPGGDVVLLLHGFGADRFAWLATAPALTPSAHVIAGELPGHGAAAEERIASFDAMIDDALYALASDAAWQGATRRHVVGHSLGGALGIAIAARSEAPVATLTAIVPLGIGAPIDLDWVRALVALDDETRATEHLRRLVADPRLIPPQLPPMLLRHLVTPGVRETLGVLVEAMPSIDDSLANDLDALAAIPRTLIVGEADRIVPPNEVAVTRFGGETLRLDGCGHLPQVERRAEVNEAILTRWLDTPRTA